MTDTRMGICLVQMTDRENCHFPVITTRMAVEIPFITMVIPGVTNAK
jgi:hypothetical protein